MDKCVNRDIQEMVTRGTFQASAQGAIKEDPSMIKGYEPKYILSYKKMGQDIGVAFFDVTTLKIYIGEFKEEDESLSYFRTLICQIRPVEIVQEKEQMGSGVVKMLKNSPVIPTFTNINSAKCSSFGT